MSRIVIKPSEDNGIHMLMLENGEIVHLGGYWPYPYGMAKLLCAFCGAWKRYEPVNTYFMESKNGITISSGCMCKSLICAEKYKKDKKKYINNCNFLQTLLNIEERLPLLIFLAACHKSAPVPRGKFAHMLTENMPHISSFLSANMDNNAYKYNYDKVDRDAEKYRERCEALMQKRVNRDNRLPALTFFAACCKEELAPNRLAYLLKVMIAKSSHALHKRRFSSFLSKKV
jgi:hypothetical protein